MWLMKMMVKAMGAQLAYAGMIEWRGTRKGRAALAISEWTAKL